MSEKSSYLRYLPPVLWENEPPPPQFSLGSFLRIFEKILTGIEDNAEVRHGDHTHEAITAVIARIHRYFDPWHTPEELLPWLASWVDLELPVLQGQPLWDAYQRRKVTSEISRIYRLRGLRAGLNRYLDLYAVGETRPRVAIDDGSRLLVTSPGPGGVASISAMVSQGPVVRGTSVFSEGLVRPWCITVAPNGSLFVGDTGVPHTVALPIKSRVWRISAGGGYDLGGAVPKPQAIAPETLPLNSVVALAMGSAGHDVLYVLDRSGELYSVPAPYANVAATKIAELSQANTTLWPVAMAADTNGDLLVLDRGDGPGAPNPPKIIMVKTSSLAITRRSLHSVVEPLSLLVQQEGQLIIGDAREQEPAAPGQFQGNLVRVDRTDPNNWQETLLLPTANPLVAPTAIVHGTDKRLYVLDVGLKPFVPQGDPFVMSVAEPAAVYRVDLEATPALATRATETGQLVFPTGMASQNGQLVICDPGQPEVSGLTPVWTRLAPFRFGVVIHFADSRLPADPEQRSRVQHRVVGNIRSIVDAQKPAHSLWDLVTAI